MLYLTKQGNCIPNRFLVQIGLSELNRCLYDGIKYIGKDLGNYVEKALGILSGQHVETRENHVNDYFWHWLSKIRTANLHN